MYFFQDYFRYYLSIFLKNFLDSIVEFKIGTNNIDFYNNLGPDNLQKIASDVSFEDNLDLKRIKHLFKDTKHILEVGAGYGRVLNYLTKNLFTKKISAIELSYSMASHLTLKHAQQAKIIHDNILNLSFKFNKPDLVLWMWSGYGDLDEDDQKIALDKIYDNSAQNVKLVIDIPDVETLSKDNKKAKVGNFINKNEAVIEHPLFGMYKAYFPTSEDMKINVQNSKFSKLEIDKYSINDSDRVQFIISK